MQLVSEQPSSMSVPLEHGEFGPAFAQLREILQSYLNKHPGVTIGGMSKRCAVSEPTLRRIKSGQVKTLPSITTVIEILSYISKESSLRGILSAFPGPIAIYLERKMPPSQPEVDIQFSARLSEALKDPVKYMIYKLAVMPIGVSSEKVADLFGRYGETQLRNLLQEDLIKIDHRGRYVGKVSDFALSNEVFVEHFKTTADFIKPHKHATSATSHSPIFSNFSSSINKKAYSEILKVQRAANKRIMNILSDTSSAGTVPTFFLSAVDTLDNKCADEFSED